MNTKYVMNNQAKKFSLGLMGLGLLINNLPYLFY